MKAKATESGKARLFRIPVWMNGIVAALLALGLITNVVTWHLVLAIAIGMTPPVLFRLADRYGGAKWLVISFLLYVWVPPLLVAVLVVLLKGPLWVLVVPLLGYVMASKVTYAIVRLVRLERIRNGRLDWAMIGQPEGLDEMSRDDENENA